MAGIQYSIICVSLPLSPSARPFLIHLHFMNESFHIHNCSGFAVLVGHGESGESFVYLHFLIYIPDLLWGFHGIFTNLIEAILAAVFYSGLFEVSAGGVLSFLPFSNMYRLE